MTRNQQEPDISFIYCFDHQIFICLVIVQGNFLLKISGQDKTNEKADSIGSLKKVLKNSGSPNIFTSLHFWN
jgi:cytochrome oxidase Cu insertion factor (SCO1/SenC/PrrC family)